MSRSEWFDGPTGPGDGSSRPEGPDDGGGGRPRTAGRRRRGPLGTTLLVMLAVVVIGGIVADVLTDVWWYDSVGFREVFVKELTTKVGIFVVAACSPAGPWRPAWSWPTAPARCTSRSHPPSRCSSSTARPSSRCDARRVGRAGRARAARRLRVGGCLAHLPALGQPRRPSGSRTPSSASTWLLRLHPAVAALRRQLRHRRPRAGVRRGRLHALRLRRPSRPVAAPPRGPTS